jgi:hypothetical protein
MVVADSNPHIPAVSGRISPALVPQDGPASPRAGAVSMGPLADSKQATQIGTGLKLCRSWNSGGRHTARSPRLRLQLSPRLGPFVLRRLIGLGLQNGQIDHIARQVLGGYFGVRQLGEFRHFSQSILGCFHHNGKAALLDLGMYPVRHFGPQR